MDNRQSPQSSSNRISPLSRSYSRSTPIEVPYHDYPLEQQDKKHPSDTIKTIGSADYDDEGSPKQAEEAVWRPGFFSQFPVLGFGALVTVLICAAASVVTLLVSDGKSQTHWPEKLAPNVVLSGLNSVANICYGIAIGNGIAIAWWRQTLKGASIEQLHKSWSFSTSLKSVAMAGRYFNVIALAALTTKLTIVDNMLMQRATTTYIDTDGPVTVHNVTMFANETIPMTGFVGGRVSDPSVMLGRFNQDVITWLQNGGLMPAWGDGYQGTYFLNVAAAGFEFDCTAPITVPINYGDETANASSYAGNHNGSLAGTNLQFAPTLFSLTFGNNETIAYTDAGAIDPSVYSYLTMDIVYTNATDKGTTGYNCGISETFADPYTHCFKPGTKTTQSCKLRPAVIEYPVMIKNTTLASTSRDATAENSLTSSVVSLQGQPAMYFESFQDSAYSITASGGEYKNYPWTVDYDGYFGVLNRTNRQANGFKVLAYKDIYEEHNGAGETSGSYLGGIQQALQMTLGGKADIYFGGTVGYQIEQQGNAQQYLTNAPSASGSNQQQCGYQYADPMDNDGSGDWVLASVLTSINQIMLTLATDPHYNYVDGTYTDVVRPVQSYNATLVRESVHYQTHQPYMWGAFASMLVCVILVLPTYWGFWQLGRKVSLGPFEIANAFRSPMTAGTSNGTVDDVIKEVGHRQVKFGHIVAGDAKGVLGVAEPEFVARVHPSVRSAHGEISEKLQQTFGRVTTH